MTTPTKEMRDALDAVKSRFEYVKDTWLDKWRIMKNADGPLRGDCEDFALTVLWNLSDKSMARFWWNLISLKAVVWYVRTKRDNGHAILHWNSMWADNTTDEWTETTEHRKIVPVPFPIIAFKMLIGRVLSR